MMRNFSRLMVIIICSALLSHCIAPHNPLEGIDIPEPVNADEGYYFFRAAKVIRFKQKDNLTQARADLERVIHGDQYMLYPEAYPFLIEIYNQLEISDSARWIYPEAFSKMEADPRLSAKYGDRMRSWQKAYPNFPQEFQEKDYKLMDSGPEPVGGFQRFYQILEYPEMAREMNRNGISWFAIVIEADGTLAEVQLLKSSYPDLDEAATKAIHGVDWVAAKYHDRPVNYQIIFPVYFRL